MNFEKKLEKLEKIVNDMEQGELSLENALKSFEEGVKLSRECSKELEEAEQKVKILVGIDSDGNAQTENFSKED
jgi:exodeoxyribonuclease VII small subunit